MGYTSMPARQDDGEISGLDQRTAGHRGSHRRLRGGVSELKINVGPGYRVYFTERDDELIILLAGGDKSTQAGDIEKAIELARNL